MRELRDRLLFFGVKNSVRSPVLVIFHPLVLLLELAHWLPVVLAATTTGWTIFTVTGVALPWAVPAVFAAVPGLPLRFALIAGGLAEPSLLHPPAGFAPGGAAVVSAILTAVVLVDYARGEAGQLVPLLKELPPKPELVHEYLPRLSVRKFDRLLLAVGSHVLRRVGRPRHV